MALNAEIGGASANSYVDVTFADAYLEDRLNTSAWPSDDVQKEKALVEATRELDVLAFLGYRVTSTQALSFPREGVYKPDDPNGAEYGTDEIPLPLRQATVELALEFLRAGSTDLATINPRDAVIRSKTDVLETEYDPSLKVTGLSRFPRVLNLISHLLSEPSSGSTFRRMRA